jgi:hypothetical protein
VDSRGNSPVRSLTQPPAGGPSAPAPARPHAAASRLLEYTLAAGIFLGSLALWVVVPFGSLWLASKIGDDAQTVVLSALIITPVCMLACGLGLSALYGAYLRVSHARPVGNSRSAWLGSLSGGRKPTRARRPILDTSLTISAGTAIVLLLVWFLFLAENYSPAGFVP